MATLQGLPRAILNKLIQAAGGNGRTVGQALGDAMSIYVLMRLLPRALYSTGLLDSLPQDVWECASRGGVTVRPDEFYG